MRRARDQADVAVRVLGQGGRLSTIHSNIKQSRCTPKAGRGRTAVRELQPEWLLTPGNMGDETYLAVKVVRADRHEASVLARGALERAHI